MENISFNSYTAKSPQNSPSFNNIHDKGVLKDDNLNEIYDISTKLKSYYESFSHENNEILNFKLKIKNDLNILNCYNQKNINTSNIDDRVSSFESNIKNRVKINVNFEEIGINNSECGLITSRYGYQNNINDNSDILLNKHIDKSLNVQAFNARFSEHSIKKKNANICDIFKYKNYYNKYNSVCNDLKDTNKFFKTSEIKLNDIHFYHFNKIEDEVRANITIANNSYSSINCKNNNVSNIYNTTTTTTNNSNQVNDIDNTKYQNNGNKFTNKEYIHEEKNKEEQNNGAVNVCYQFDNKNSENIHHSDSVNELCENIKKISNLNESNEECKNINNNENVKLYEQNNESYECTTVNGLNENKNYLIKQHNNSKTDDDSNNIYKVNIITEEEKKIEESYQNINENNISALKKRKKKKKIQNLKNIKKNKLPNRMKQKRNFNAPYSNIRNYNFNFGIRKNNIEIYNGYIKRNALYKLNRNLASYKSKFSNCINTFKVFRNNNSKLNRTSINKKKKKKKIKKKKLNIGKEEKLSCSNSIFLDNQKVNFQNMDYNSNSLRRGNNFNLNSYSSSKLDKNYTYNNNLGNRIRRNINDDELCYNTDDNCIFRNMRRKKKKKITYFCSNNYFCKYLSDDDLTYENYCNYFLSNESVEKMNVSSYLHYFKILNKKKFKKRINSSIQKLDFNYDAFINSICNTNNIKKKIKLNENNELSNEEDINEKIFHHDLKHNNDSLNDRCTLTTCYDKILKNKQIKTKYIDCYRKVLLICRKILRQQNERIIIEDNICDFNNEKFSESNDNNNSDNNSNDINNNNNYNNNNSNDNIINNDINNNNFNINDNNNNDNNKDNFNINDYINNDNNNSNFNIDDYINNDINNSNFNINNNNSNGNNNDNFNINDYINNDNNTNNNNVNISNINNSHLIDKEASGLKKHSLDIFNKEKNEYDERIYDGVIKEKVEYEEKIEVCDYEKKCNRSSLNGNFQCSEEYNEDKDKNEFNEIESNTNEHNIEDNNEKPEQIQENDELNNFNDNKDEITECNYDEDINNFYVKDEVKEWNGNDTDEINELEIKELESIDDENNELDEEDIKGETSSENNESTLRLPSNDVDAVKSMNENIINNSNFTCLTNENSIKAEAKVKIKNKNIQKNEVKDKGRKRKKNNSIKKNDEIVKVYGDIIKENTTNFLYKNFVIPKKSHNYTYLNYKEIKEYLKNLTVLKSGVNWKTYKIEDLPSELYKNIRPINQRVTGFKTVLLVDELFEKLWEFPLTDMIKIRTVTRGDQFIGDIRIDFYYRQSERTLCRACGRHILKQKFATEHYQRNINCWKEVMWRLGIPELHYYNSVRNDFFDPRIASIDNNNEQLLLDRALILYNQELIKKATDFVNEELKYYEDNAINKESKKSKGNSCLELDILVLDDNNILLPTMKSELDEPYFEISAIYPSNGFADENYSKNFCFIKITFNKLGGMVLRDLFTLECEFLVDWGDNLLIQAKKYTLHEIYNNSDSYDVNLRNLYDQGFAYLRCNVPQKSYGKVNLKVRIPKTVWHYWEAIADETSKVSYEFLDKNNMHRHLLFCSYLDNINKNFTTYIKNSYKNNYAFDFINNQSNYTKSEEDYSQGNVLDKKTKSNVSESLNNKIIPYNFSSPKAEINDLNNLNTRMLYNQNNTYNNIDYPLINNIPYQNYQNFNINNVHNDSDTNYSKNFDQFNTHLESNF
ncbi:conserved Plasmodium protein, unknown function [Plasmodium relictum]|uniref:Uncharacterized protein n=1 Tax=Plasmodium relictum TaxID=85471 RepID=A0A1J1H9X7_PLARL|nr:conserved Plasmodium protein, unknown function [Plasmodium relictum]CRH01778.1 conserved Plasmodium protein, unknown function [Plasmodium relictum]